MELRKIQRLAATTIDSTQFSELAAHGEDLLVERKVQLPMPEKLGAEVASMANAIGGWLLLGVDDRTHKLHSVDLPKGDLQSHIGNLLRGAVDPVPPFLAGTLDIGGTTVGFVRVFQASVPVIVSGSGAVYSRDAGGKVPVGDHRALLDLARRGSEAVDAARRRPDENAVSRSLLGLGRDRVPSEHLRSIVRAAPLTVSAQLTEWPISEGPRCCREAARGLASSISGDQDVDVLVRPHGRCVMASASPSSRNRRFESFEVLVLADCAGVFAVSISRVVNNATPTELLRSRYLEPAIEVVATIVEQAEALGDAVLDVHLICGRTDAALQDARGDFENHRLGPRNHCGSAIVSFPADKEDQEELARRWEREIARNVGISMWEPAAS